MLRFVEEIILLLLRDEDGRFIQVPTWSMDYAVAGAILMDLAMENRIDTDLHNLILIDSTPLGDPVLDPVLAQIANGESHDSRYWVEQISRSGPDIREQTLGRLVEKGILENEDDRFLWVFRSRRYPSVDGEAEREVKLRIMNVLFSDEIPDPSRPDDYLPCRCVQHISSPAFQAGTRPGIGPDRAGWPVGPDRPGHDSGNQGHPGFGGRVLPGAHDLTSWPDGGPGSVDFAG